MTPRTTPDPTRTRVLFPAAVSAAAATSIAGIFFAGSAGAVSGVATSTLVNLTISDVPVLTLKAFHGAYGTGGVPALGGDDTGDFSDPDGVLSRVSVSGPVTSRTSATSAKNYAQAQLIAGTGSKAPLRLSMNGKTLLSVTSLDAYAECAAAPGGPTALAHIHTDPNSVTVLGQAISVGTTSIPVTGADVGVPAVATGTVRVVYTQVANPSVQTSGLSSASAHAQFTITGTFKDASGKELYSGPVEDLKLGDVSATCPAPAPPTSADAAPSAPAAGPAATPPPPGAPANAPALPAAPAGAAAATRAPSGHLVHHPARLRPPLPRTGGTGDGPADDLVADTAPPQADGPSGWWPVMSVLGLAAGGAMFVATRRRGRGTHQ